MRRPLTRPYVVLLLCTVSFFVAEGLKTYLKNAFGRTWPESWMGPHISFIRDGAYGFNPFHGGPAYTDFPSGHMTVVCAVVSVLWFCYPKFRPLYILCALVTATLLVVTNFHFVSDLIAGTFLGISVGWITMAMWRAGVEASVASSIGKIRGSNPSDVYRTRPAVEASAARNAELRDARSNGSRTMDEVSRGRHRTCR